MWRIRNDPLALDGVTVEPQDIRHTALPYHPPTAATAIGGEHYRDFALLAECGNSAPAAVNAHLPAGENPMFKTGGYVAGVPAHSSWLRQFPPPNSDGTTETVSLSTELEEKTEEISQSKEYYFSDYDSGTTRGNLANEETIRENSTDKKTTKQKFSGMLELNAWLRNSSDMVNSVMCAYYDDFPVAIGYEQHHDFKTEKTYSNGPQFNTYTIELYDETMSSVLSNHGRALLALGSGRNENDDQIGYYATGTFSAGGNIATKIHHYKERFYDGNKHVETDENLDETRSAGGQAWSFKPVKISLPHMSLSGITQTEFTGSLTTEINVYRDTYALGDPNEHGWRESVSLYHYRITYDGEGCPPSLVDWGWTHIVKTSIKGGETQTEDTWHFDATGSVYAEYRDFNIDIDNVEDPGPSFTDGEHYYVFRPYMSGTLTEKKVTQKFGQ